MWYSKHISQHNASLSLNILSTYINEKFKPIIRLTQLHNNNTPTPAQAEIIQRYRDNSRYQYSIKDPNNDKSNWDWNQNQDQDVPMKSVKASLKYT